MIYVLRYLLCRFSCSLFHLLRTETSNLFRRQCECDINMPKVSTYASAQRVAAAGNRYMRLCLSLSVFLHSLSAVNCPRRAR